SPPWWPRRAAAAVAQALAASSQGPIRPASPATGCPVVGRAAVSAAALGAAAGTVAAAAPAPRETPAVGATVAAALVVVMRWAEGRPAQPSAFWGESAVAAASEARVARADEVGAAPPAGPRLSARRWGAE